jgi:hypothetical protein
MAMLLEDIFVYSDRSGGCSCISHLITFLILLGDQSDLLPEANCSLTPGHPFMDHWSKDHALAAFLSGGYLDFPWSCARMM